MCHAWELQYMILLQLHKNNNVNTWQVNVNETNDNKKWRKKRAAADLLCQFVPFLSSNNRKPENQYEKIA